MTRSATGLSLLALTAMLGGASESGREPWVFRATFEDRPRMVLVAAGEDLWLAFNPVTCAVHRVWRGQIALRGKVWDFSQENAAARGRTLYAAPSEVLRLPEGTLPEGWTGRGVRWEEGWAFAGDGAVLTSPPFDLTGWQRVFVAFDETSRRGPLRVELSDDGGRTFNAQHFLSCTHVNDDDAWQWNFKLVTVAAPETRLRFVQADGRFQKKLRAARVFGDRPAWLAADAATPLSTRFRGYETRGHESVTLLYDLELPGGDRVVVEHRPEVEGDGWREQIRIRGLPTGQSIVLRLAAVGRGVRRTIAPGAFHEPNGPLDVVIETDGALTITAELEP